MNDFEAQLILVCNKKARTTSQVQRLIGCSEYNYINKKLYLMCQQGLMIRKRYGQIVYYRSTDSAIMKALEHMNSRYDEELERKEKAGKMMMNIKRITEYI